MKKTCLFAIAVASFFVTTTNASALTTVTTEQELSQALSSSETEIKLGGNFTISAQISVPANKTVSIDGDGHSIGRASGYTNTLLAIPASANLSMTDLVIDGKAPGWRARLDQAGHHYNDDQTRAYGDYPVEAGADDIVASLYLIDNSGTLRLDGVTVRDSFSERAAIFSSGKLSIDNSTLIHNCNKNGWRGGAIYVKGAQSDLTVRNTHFTGNNSGRGEVGYYGDGGAIAVHESNNIEIADSYFNENTAETNGGAVYLAAAKTANILRNTFANNVAGNDGTAVHFGGTITTAYGQQNPLISFIDNVFEGNLSLTLGVEKGNGEGTLTSYGGNFKKVVLRGGRFVANRASFNSAVAIYSGTDPSDVPPVTTDVEVSGVAFRENEAETTNKAIVNIFYMTGGVEISDITYTDNGGQIYVHDNKYTSLKNITYERNDGRIYVVNNKQAEIKNISANNNTGFQSVIVANKNEKVAISDITLTNNTSRASEESQKYASLAVTSNTEASVSNIVATNNKGGRGGAVTFSNIGTTEATINASNITAYNNEATYYGGGIFVRNTAPLNLTVENSTIHDNKSNDGGGIAVLSEADHDIVFNGGTRVYSNTATNSSDDVYYSTTGDNVTGTVTLTKADKMRIGGIDGWYFDKQNARYSADNAIEQEDIVLSSSETHYLKAANKTSAPITGPIDEQDAENPATADTAVVYVVLLAAAVFVTSEFIRIKVQRRR